MWKEERRTDTLLFNKVTSQTYLWHLRRSMVVYESSFLKPQYPGLSAVLALCWIGGHWAEVWAPSLGLAHSGAALICCLQSLCLCVTSRFPGFTVASVMSLFEPCFLIVLLSFEAKLYSQSFLLVALISFFSNPLLGFVLRSLPQELAAHIPLLCSCTGAVSRFYVLLSLPPVFSFLLSLSVSLKH